MFTPHALTLSRFLVLLILFCAVPRAFAARAGEPISVLDQLAPMKAYYDSRAEWPRSHGWKPFKRYEWDATQRMDANGNIPAGAYWEAYLHHVRMPRRTLDETWAPLGPFNHGGRTRVIRFHPDDPTIMFAGAVGGGLYKSIDAGQNWFPITDHLPNLAVGCFEIHPENPDIMFLGTGEGYPNADAIKGIGLLKSTDGGLSWNTTGLAYPYTQGISILAIVLDPRDTNIVLASTNAGVYRSTDGGADFTMVRPGNATQVKRDPLNLDHLLCGVASPYGGNASMYRSTDNGLTWTAVNDGLPNTSQIGRFVLTFYPANSQIVYTGISGTFSFNGSQMIGIYRSTDNGQTWVLMSQPGENHYASQGWYDMAIAVSPDNPNRVFSSGLDLHRSINSGFQWTRITRWDLSFGDPNYVHADHHEIVFHPTNAGEVWAVTDGGIFKSVDNGDNWVEMNQGYDTFQFYAMGNATLDTTLAYGGTQDNGSNRYAGDPDWNEVFGGDGGYCVVDYTDDNTIYVEYQNGNRYRSDDGGFNFSSINPGIDGNGAWVTPMLLDPFDHLTIYTTTSNGGVWRSENQGRFGQWENIGDVGGTNQVLAASPLVPGLLYLGSSGNVWRRDPETGQWAGVSGNLPGSYVTRVVPDPLNPDGVFATVSGFGGGHVFRSTQGGTIWQDISGNLPNAPFQDLIVDQTEPGKLYAGGDLGVYVTMDGGQSWEIFGDGLPTCRIDDMEMQAVTGKLRVATHGRGMWEIATGSSDVALLYPNGGETFAVGTEIQFRWSGLTHGGDVALDINRDYPDGAWQSVIATANDGEETWTVSGPVSDNVRFRIVHQTDPSQSDTTDAESRIADPVINLLYPNGGETVLSGDFDTLRFERVLVDEALVVELNRSYPEGDWEVLEALLGNDSIYRWIVQLPGGEHCRVRLTSTTRPEISDMSDEDFILRPPAMTLLSPNGGEVLQAGVEHEVRWEAPEHEARVRITVNRSYPDGNWEAIGPNVMNSGSYLWTPSEPGTIGARLRIAAIYDPASTYVESAANFTIQGLAADETAVPAEFRVGEAYPNPFNPSTRIGFDLPSRTRVTATVFNHLGQEIQRLVDEVLEAGTHRLDFSADNLSSGIYFVHVSAYGETRILKTVLLK